MDVSRRPPIDLFAVRTPISDQSSNQKALFEGPFGSPSPIKPQRIGAYSFPTECQNDGGVTAKAFFQSERFLLIRLEWQRQ
jgi:hypothetical protein